jgi:hypothetical protein
LTPALPSITALRDVDTVGSAVLTVSEALRSSVSAGVFGLALRGDLREVALPVFFTAIRLLTPTEIFYHSKSAE